MIERIGTLHVLAKDIKNLLTHAEEEKVVHKDWLEVSQFGQRMEDEGYALRWSKPERIETRKLQGWEILYEIDEKKWIKYRLENSDGSTLIGRKFESK